MRPRLPVSVSSLNLVRGLRAACGGGALLAAIAVPRGLEAQTTGRIVNTVRADVTDKQGNKYNQRVDSSVVLLRSTTGGGGGGGGGTSGPQIKITKDVDRAEAQAGDVLSFTIRYEVTGTGTVDLQITDVIPTYTVYIPGSLRIDGRVTTDAKDNDDGELSNALIVARRAGVASGTSGTITFQVRVAAGSPAGAAVKNRAIVSCTGSTPCSAETNETTTTIVVADLRLTKAIVGATTVKPGDQVQYRIVARNASSNVAIHNLQISDVLPVELDLVSTSPTAAQEAAQLTWQRADLNPGDSAVLTLTTRARPVSARTTVTNTVTASSGALVASANAVLVIEPPATLGLQMDLSSQALEVSPGGTTQLVGEVRNASTIALADVLAEFQLAHGTRYVPGSLGGGDSVSANGSTLVVRLPGALAPGAARRVRFSIAVVAADVPVLETRATARSRDGDVVSAADSVQLHLRGTIPVSSVIGKVWNDQNSNGRQDAGEAGVSGVDVWSDDGAVSRTDASGKFSFVNLRPGTHVFRVDPATVPASYAIPNRGDGLARVHLSGWTSQTIALPLRATGVAVKPSTDGRQLSPDCITASTGAGMPCTKRTDSTAQVRVAPKRRADERAADKRNDLVAGPGVEIFAPNDGSVVALDKAWIGVRSERGKTAMLFHGDSVVGEERVRPDGVAEFINVGLREGPNTFSVRTINSMRKVRWDSIVVHLSGAPARIVPETTTIVMPADGNKVRRLRVRVFDKWGVPVVNKPFLDVAFDGGTIASEDASRASTGMQVQADEQGWAEVEVKAGLTVRRGLLRVGQREHSVEVPVELVAPALPFMLTGIGQVGVGAAEQSFGSITARGRVDDRTAVTVSYDSRRVESANQAFGRVAGPIDEGMYPLLGDDSQRRVMSSARGQLSARVERGLDAFAFGDVQTGNNDDPTLMRYARSLTGAAGRVSTGAVRWSGFGAMSSQALRQVQLRGAGTSGPYLIGNAIIPGTEQVHIELRERNDAQRVLTRQLLVPFTDYEIDPTRGMVLLKHPLPSADAEGNSIFLVVTAEAQGTLDRRAVWGVRAQSDLAQLFTGGQPRGVGLGASVVHDGQGLESRNLVGADLSVSPTKAISLRGEVAQSASTDSTGLATMVDANVGVFGGALTLRGRYSHIGDEFRNPANLALMPGTQDITVGLGVRVGDGEVRFDHDRQDFDALGISRRRSTVSLRQTSFRTTELEMRLVGDQVQGGTDDRNGGAGEMKLSWMPVPRVKLWGEARNQLWTTTGVAGTGDFVGGGAALQVSNDVSLEARHLQVSGPNGNYSLTSLGTRSRLIGGTQAWGSYQLVGGEQPGDATVVGLNNRLALGNDWTVNTMFERRVGVQHSAVDDPVRALPFSQTESDYWSTGLGVEFAPSGLPYRLSARGEQKQGTLESSRLATFSGDFSFNNSLGMLAHNELSQRDLQTAISDSRMHTERMSSVWGLALRPTGSDKVNALVEARWLDETNPLTGGVLNRQGEEQRLIGAAELIYSPAGWLTMGARYATRQTRSIVAVVDGGDEELRSSAGYLGTRLDLGVTRWFALRADARALQERLTDSQTWDVAPSLVFHPVEGLEMSSGYRWGTLRDIDFAINGGSGFFMTFGARITESSMPTAAAFWRGRFARQPMPGSQP